MRPKISSREELQYWLVDNPITWSQVVALRSALRMFPIVADPLNWHDPSVSATSIIAALRALAVSSAVAVIPTNDALEPSARAACSQNHLIDTASDAASGSIQFAFRAAYVTGATVPNASPARRFKGIEAAASGANQLAASVANDDTELGSYSAAVYDEIRNDLQALKDGVSPESLRRHNLWRDPHGSWGTAWNIARKWLSGSGQGFEIWREWYHGRLEGLPYAFANFDDAADEKFYRWIVEHDDKWWSREPAEVNREITEFVDALRRPKAEPLTDSNVDFVISSAPEDGALAREVMQVVFGLGKSAELIGPAASKQERRNAIKRADRVIPLYTKNYVQSDDCVSDWVHAYNLDTATAEQRMIALRFDQADLKPLMNGVSVHDISRLLPEQRKQAIAKWIEWKPLPLTRTNVEKTLTTHLDPGVEAAGTGEEAKLDTVRDAVLNEPQLPAQLANAMKALRLMLDLARLSERNLSSMMQSVLKLYDDHFTEHGRDSSWGGLDRYMTVVSEGTADLSAATMREEKAALEQLIAAHGNCMDALASADEQKRELAHVPVYKADQPAIDGVIDKLKDVAELAHNQDASTDSYDKEAKNLVAQGRDFAFEVGAPDADKKPATARMRFLRYVGGFGIKTLSVLGSMASIRQTPEFEKLLKAAEDLVEEFYKMIGL